jgi:hypothetical protein
MLTIRGIYDGKAFSALPNEPLPEVHGEVPVAIVFLNEPTVADQRRQREREAAQRMRAARNAMPSLGMGVKELIEAGRER